MKILLITPFFPPDRGGIAIHTKNLYEKLRNAGHKVFIISPKSRDNYSNDPNFIRRIPSIFLSSWPFPTLKSVSIPLDFGFKISKIIREINPDIIHVHGHHYPICWMGTVISYRNKIPVILTLHGMYSLNPGISGGKTAIEEAFNLTIFKNLLKKTNSIIGLTPHITNYARKYYLSNRLKYFTIPNGINTLQFKNNISNRDSYRVKHGIEKDSMVILFCGRLEKVKGILEYANAVKHYIDKKSTLNDVHFLIVGSGTYTQLIHKIFCNSPNVQIVDWQPSDLIHEYYIMADVFVIPSKFEALPITIIEAMNANLHIIYTDVGGISEILNSYKPKTLLKTVSSDVILETLIQIITNRKVIPIDSQSIQYAGSLDWSNIIPRIVNVYSDTLTRRSNTNQK